MAGIDQDSLDGYCNCFDGFMKDVFALLGAWPVLGVWPVLGAWPVLALIPCFFVCKNNWKGGCLIEMFFKSWERENEKV